MDSEKLINVIQRTSIVFMLLMLRVFLEILCNEYV